MNEAILQGVALFVSGAIGGFVRQLIIGNGSIVLWRVWFDEKTGKRGIDLGIVASLFLGGVVGVVVDQSNFTAFTWGMTGSYVLEELIKRDMNGPKNGDRK